MPGSFFAYFLTRLLPSEVMRDALAHVEVKGRRALAARLSAVRFAREANRLRLCIPGTYSRD